MHDLLAQCTTLDALWHRFAATHAIVWDTLTYPEYAAHAPTFGPWLMQTLTTSAPVAHCLWELVWSSLTAQPWRLLKSQIALDLVEAGAVWWATPFTVEASGFDALYFSVRGLLQSLQIADEENVETAARRLKDLVVAFSSLDPQTGLGVRVEVPVAGQEYAYGVRFQDIVGHVAIFSGLPACQAYTTWYLHEFIPAYMRHGWYNPTTGHAPPPGQELAALEQREHGRDLLNALVPGMGDVAAGQRPSTAEGRRLLWHRIVDEEGHVEFVNDADLPDDDEEE